MTRKRVLHLADSPYFGGITSHILNVAEAFRDDPDWEIVLATLPGKRADRALYERADAADIEVTTIRMSSTFDATVRGRLRDFVESNQFAIVHTHAYRANIVATHAALPIPVVTTSHGLAVKPTLRLHIWQAIHLRKMRHLPAVIACSDFVSKTLASRGVPKNVLRVVHNGCPSPATPEKGVRRGTYDFPGDKLIALYVGRLAPGKDVDRFLDALPKTSGYYGVVAGDGPLFKELVDHIAANRVSCSFVGAVPDPTPYYHLADVVVLPTEMEALPMTLIEAASHGKPVIATNVGGVSEVVVQGETGVLVDDNRVESWVDALGKLTDASLRTRLGEAARIRHREDFSLETLRNGLSAVYRDVLSNAT